jgi:hypothetical protein
MDPERLRKILKAVEQGEMTADGAAEKLRTAPGRRTTCRHRELGSRGVERVSNPPEPDGVVLIDVAGGPLLVGHADPQTTRLYDRMEQKDEESRGEDFDLG